MKNKIDWKNHAISFLSALLGILIAFQLEDYQDERQEEAKLKVTLRAIRNEIENNRKIYQTNVDRLSDFLAYFELLNAKDEKGHLVLDRRQFEMMNARSPYRFQNWTVLRQLNDSTSVFDTHHDFRIDTAPETGISTSSWRAGLYEGILNRLDNNTLSELTSIYEWIEKDIGLNEREFYESVVLTDNTRIGPLIGYYNRIVATDRFKLEMINKHYDVIVWGE